MKTTDLVDNQSLRDDIPQFFPGDELKVHVRVVEGGKERVQVFQGNVIRRQGSGLQETYTVRKLSYGVGVERTFPRCRRSRSSSVATSVAPSCTTCVIGWARPPRSARSANSESLIASARQRPGQS